jgi:hypothetical protein
VKHGWRDLAAASLDSFEAEAKRVRAAAVDAYRHAAALRFTTSEERKHEELGRHALAGAYRIASVQPLSVALTTGAYETLLTPLPMNQGAGPEAVEKRAQEAGAAAELEFRAARLAFKRARPALVRGYRRAGLAVESHTRTAGGKLRNTEGLTPEALSLTSQQSAKRCETRQVLLRCSCRDGWKVAAKGCGSADCVLCADEVAARRARRARQRVAEVRPELPERRASWCTRQGDPVHYVTLTVPPELRARYVDPAAWRELARLAWRILQRQHGMVFACEATHPVGDKGAERAELDGDPCTFAPHLNFLAVQRRGWRWTLDLPALRSAWAEALGWTGPHAVQVRVELHFPQSQREEDRKAWAHVTRYVLRPFPGWQAWLPSLRWFGKFPRGIDYTCTCPACKAQFAIVATGDAAMALYYARAAALGIDLRALLLPRRETPQPSEEAPWVKQGNTAIAAIRGTL